MPAVVLVRDGGDDGAEDARVEAVGEEGLPGRRRTAGAVSVMLGGDSLVYGVMTSPLAGCRLAEGR